MDLNALAINSAEVRQAADYALGISENLNKLNRGPVFENERRKMVLEVGQWFAALAKVIGKETQ